MSRRYASDHKALVLKILVSFKYDVTATSRYTGIPERTLRDWTREIPLAARSRLVAATTKIVSRRQP